MSIDMDVYNDVDVVAVAREVQVSGSDCGRYPTVNEDTEMEDISYFDVEMLDANEGVDVVTGEDVEMKKVVDMMDVDGDMETEEMADRTSMTATLYKAVDSTQQEMKN